MVRRVAFVVVLLAGLSHTEGTWGITPVAPFSGEFTEGFESLSNGYVPGPEMNVSGPVCVLGGQATLTGVHAGNRKPLYVWSSIGGFSLGGFERTAVPFDGTQGVHLASGLTTDGSVGRFDFSSPISEFGGYWVHAETQERGGPVIVEFFDEDNVSISSEQFTYDTDLDGVSQWFGWSSETPIGAVEFSGYYAGVDGVQINMLEAPSGDEPPCRSYDQPVTLDRDTTIDASLSYPDSGVDIVDGINGATTVELVDGGNIATRYLAASDVHGSSRLEILGGKIGGPVNVHESGQLRVAGGEFAFYMDAHPAAPSVDTAAIVARGSSTIEIMDGQSFRLPTGHFYSPVVLATDDSTVLIHGGTYSGPVAVASGSSTVTMLDGDLIFTNDADGFHVLESSTLNIMGGAFDVDDGVGVYAAGSSEVNVSGGTVSGNDGTGLWLTGSSRGNVSGGVVRGDTGISVKDQGIVTVSDGTVTGTDDTGLRLVGSAQGNILRGVVSGENSGIYVKDRGIATVWDGMITGMDGAGLRIEGSARGNILGGLFRGENAGIHVADHGIVNVYGGQLLASEGPALMVSNAAVAHIFGSDLVISGTSLSGALADGTEFTLEFETRGSGQVVLHEIPEPSTFALVGLAAVALLWMRPTRVN